MTELPLRKRGRDPELLVDSTDVLEPKRFHGEKTELFLQLLQLDQSLADEDEEEEFAPSEELVKGVMRSLEEEIVATCSTSYPSSNSPDNSAGSDIYSGHEDQSRDSDWGVYLCYLLDASDDELGIPPVPDMGMKEACPSSKEPSESLRENTDLNYLCENWHLDNDFEDYQQFALYNNDWDAIQLDDYMNGNVFGQAVLFDGQFAAAWRL